MPCLHVVVLLGQAYIGATGMEGIRPEDGVPGVTKPFHTHFEIAQLISRPVLPLSVSA